MKAYSLKISGRLLCGPPKENALWKTKVSVFMPSWPSGSCCSYCCSYSHDYEAHSITLRFADDASQNLLFTVYSDGVCQVNGKFVFLRSPDGNAEAIYQLLRDAVV